MRQTFLIAGICLLLGFSCFGANTALIIDSSPATEPIARGQSFYLTPSNGNFTATKNFRNGVTITFGSSTNFWELDFAAGGNSAAEGNALLTPGVYENTDFFTFPDVNDPTYHPDYSNPGLSVARYPGAYGLYGTFTVLEVAYGAGNTITRFHATFVAHPIGGGLLTGEIFFNATASVPPQNHITSSLVAQATEGRPFIYQITTTTPVTTYYAYGLPAGVLVNSATGRISGNPNRKGTFYVVVKGVNMAGATSSIVVLTVGPPVFPAGAYTAVRTDSDPGDFIGEGESSLFTTNDTIFTATSSHAANSVEIHYATRDHMHSRWLHFASLDSAPLHIGVYENAALRVTGDSRGCNTATGSFEIKDIWIDAAGVVNRFQASFTQHCEGATPATRGEVWIREPHAILGALRSTITENESFSYQILANTHPTTFGATGLPPGLTINTHTGLISGRPRGSGMIPITVSAIGSGGTASDTVMLDILPSEFLANISTRGFVGGGSKSLIGGFIINRFASKKILVRALGPSLTQNGILGVNTDPYFNILDANRSGITWNYDWQVSSTAISSADQKAQITQTGAAPTDAKEAAVVATLPPGSYTVVAGDSSIAHPAGIGLIEVYDISQATPTRLVNISTRGWVGTGNNAMIGGFIVGGTPGTGGTMLILAKGPSLTQGGVPGALADPVVELHDKNGTLLAANDNWTDTQQPDIAATGIPPSSPTEAGILRRFSPGSYTAIVHGKGSATGAALVEVYQIR